MAQMTKSQKEMIALGVVVLAIIGVLIWYYSGSQPAPPPTAVSAPVPTEIRKDTFTRPDYTELTSPAKLPPDIGLMGRDNPFNPY